MARRRETCMHLDREEFQMVDIQSYMRQLLDGLKTAFLGRLLYLGLQGSYRRGEATASSDMDIMVILDVLTVEDMGRYREIIARMPEPERSCGFICGKEDMKHWNRGEICQLLHETQDYYGRLAEYVPAFSEEDVRTHIRISTDNLYHALCHGFIHGSDETKQVRLQASYKSVFYILQNRYYLKTGTFYITKKELAGHLDPEDQRVMEWAVRLKTQSDYDFDEAYQTIFSWCQALVQGA